MERNGERKPLVSVLVRARNDETLIGRTLAGVFGQKTDFPFEVVVCDDASTDLRALSDALNAAAHAEDAAACRSGAQAIVDLHARYRAEA